MGNFIVVLIIAFCIYCIQTGAWDLPILIKDPVLAIGIAIVLVLVVRLVGHVRRSR
jgi:hypothetical protein